MPDRFVEDLRTLLLQLNAGVQLLEEYMDEVHGGDWVKVGRRPPADGRHAWSDLAMAWVNLGHVLVRLEGVEPWTIAPLVTRGQKGERTLWEFGPDGQVAVDEFDGELLSRARVPEGLVRPVTEPTEPRYTLDEARKILEVCQEHTWLADVDDDGKPVGVRCATCGEKRPLR